MIIHMSHSHISAKKFILLLPLFQTHLLSEVRGEVFQWEQEPKYLKIHLREPWGINAYMEWNDGVKCDNEHHGTLALMTTWREIYILDLTFSAEMLRT